MFAQVARVLRPGGIYYFAIANPFYAGLTEADWNGEGYTLNLPYVDGAPVTLPDAEWVYANSKKERPAVRECREYRQTFSKLLNGLIELNFELFHVSDSKHLWPDPEAQPGTWSHLISIAPVWLSFWLRYQPANAGV